jgi:hypothetical protein
MLKPVRGDISMDPGNLPFSRRIMLSLQHIDTALKPLETLEFQNVNFF